ncbi:MAG TPA: FAD-dependent monooxygenase [Pseudonocardia sp.]
MPRVAVVGGSLGGLTAALVLADIGCDVVVHERSGVFVQDLRANAVAALAPAQLAAYPGDRTSALGEWERRQLALGRDLLQRNRVIGDGSQLHGTFRPGDPALIFGLQGPGR